jgi:hypothetical protein
LLSENQISGDCRDIEKLPTIAILQISTGYQKCVQLSRAGNSWEK